LNERRLICLLKEEEEIEFDEEERAKGRKVNQWSGIELNQSHSAPFD